MTERLARWETPEARELASSLGLGDAAEAIRRHARTLLAERGDGSVPVRLSAFFEWAGVRKVKNEELPLEGALRRLPDGRFDIVVRADRAPTRQRFSIAHELGHILFYRNAPDAKARQAALGSKAPEEEERLCNIAAEELLMPAAVVRETLASAEGADRVIHLARQCEVSIEAAMVRVAPLWPERGELQLWEYRDQWKPTLVRRLGRLRSSLATFIPDEWNGQKAPDSARLPWRGVTTLYSKEKRVQLSARTVVLPLSRRLRTLLVSHELVKDSARAEPTALEQAARVRVRRAAVAAPRRDCSECAGTGWVDPKTYDPADRLKPVPICRCRFNYAVPA